MGGMGPGFRREDRERPAIPNPTQVRHDVTPAFVGDGDLREARAEFGGLCDDPNPGFGPEPAGNHAAEIVVVDFDRRRRVLLSTCPSSKHRQG